MTYSRKPKHKGYHDYHADYLLLADGSKIGGTYYCCADQNHKRWASYGPAGLSWGHPNRTTAEQVQIDAHGKNS